MWNIWRTWEQHTVAAAVGSAGTTHQEHCTVPSPSRISVCSGLEQPSHAEIHHWSSAVPQRPCTGSSSTGSDSPTHSDLVLSRRTGTHHELGASTLFSLGTHREQARGSNGSDDTVGSAGRGVEILESCPLGLPEVDGQVNVPHCGRRDMEGRWVQGSFKTIAYTGVSPTQALACLESLGCILYVPSPSPTPIPRWQ